MGTNIFETTVDWNLAILKNCSKYMGFPVRVHNGTVFVDDRWWKRLLWSVTFSLLVLRTVCIICGWVLCNTVDRFSNPRFDPLYLLLVVFATAVTYGVHLLFNQHIGNYVLVWRAILQYKSTTVDVPKFQILLLLSVGPTNIFMWSMINTFFALNTDLVVVQFGFGVNWAHAQGYLDDGWGYRSLVILTTIADYWSGFAIATSLGLLTFHLLFLEVWAQALMVLIHSAKTFKINAHRTWRKLQELLVILRVFNVSNSTIVMIVKFDCLGLSILCISQLLLMPSNGDFVVWAVMAYSATVAVFLYPAFYYRAYNVGEGLETAKLEFGQILRFKIQDSSFERRLRSVSTKGIWVGSFRTYERDSTPTYFDFILAQVVDVVLASNS